jgi:hypothetical protein
MTALTGQQGQIELGTDHCDMTTGKGLLGQDIRDGKSWTGQPGQESLDGTAGEDCRGGTGRKERTGRPDHDS